AGSTRSCCPGCWATKCASPRAWPWGTAHACSRGSLTSPRAASFRRYRSGVRSTYCTTQDWCLTSPTASISAGTTVALLARSGEPERKPCLTLLCGVGTGALRPVVAADDVRSGGAVAGGHRVGSVCSGYLDERCPGARRVWLHVQR